MYKVMKKHNGQLLRAMPPDWFFGPNMILNIIRIHSISQILMNNEFQKNVYEVMKRHNGQLLQAIPPDWFVGPNVLIFMLYIYVKSNNLLLEF